MDYIHINKLVTTSIYKQIASSITNAIDDGLLKFNDKLPTEKEICEAYQISNTAVKMAYDKLIKEGLIKRIKGKGTFVTNRPTYKTALHSFYELEVSNYNSNKYTYKVILLNKLNKDYSTYRALKLKIGERCYQVDSVIKNKNNPVMLEKVYFPKKYFSNFRNIHEQYKGVFDFVERVNNYKIKHFHSTYSAINASSAEALLLNIEADDAICFVRTLIVDDLDRVIGYVCSYFPGDFSEFEVIVHAI
jgi:GntR family transcriptional regulator